MPSTFSVSGSVVLVLGVLLMASCTAPAPVVPPVTTSADAAPPALSQLESARGHTWTLSKWVSTSGAVRPAGLITFELMDAGKIAGRGPVNRYFGRIDYSGTQIRSWQPIGSTKMAGTPEAMAAEAAYFQELVQMRTVRFEANRLILVSPEGGRMEFERSGGSTAPSP